MKTIALLLLALLTSTTSSWAARHPTTRSSPEAFVDVAAEPAYAFDRPTRYAASPRHWTHHRASQRHQPARQTHPDPSEGATIAQRAPLSGGSSTPLTYEDQQLALSGSAPSAAAGVVDGLSMVTQRAVGGCGVSFRHNLVDCKSGASTSVSSAMLPHAQCLLRWLDAAGYPVKDIGGFGERHNPSAHPTGNALDVNQLSRNVVSVRFPAGVTAAAERCGLVHGAVWSNPDTGHFEMPGKFGYVGFSRYARRSYIHVRYAHHFAHRRHYAGA